ncbi:hypothetical protein ACJIZ3_006765 [Penstemon smallii]|uniref:Uncharacterized protein n=1 Tax=Penstemon smallii TaxID=265156 RepID=A0ABD3S8L8_9LAMI
MERDNRKRTRDEGDDIKESHKGKKGKGSELCEGINGIFDFPWLNESVVFKEEEYLDPVDTFAPSLYLDEIPSTYASNLDQSSLQNEKNLNDDSNFLSFQVDDFDFEPIDCIWNSLIDEPIETGNLDKP